MNKPFIKVIPANRRHPVEQRPGVEASSRSRFLARLVREKPLGAVSAVVVLLLILVSIFADALAPYDIFEVNAKNRLQGRYDVGTGQQRAV